MSSRRYDIAIIGGGIVGLASALGLSERFPGLSLAVLEKEERFAQHQSGHNSGVIHSGIYYRPGSEKARLCVEGVRRLNDFCHRHGVKVEPRGKVIVATHPEELPRLQELFERGQANGVPDLELIEPERLREIEPYAAGLKALHSPTTSTVDFKEVCSALEKLLRSRGLDLVSSAAVKSITEAKEELHLSTSTETIRSRRILNCAGLYSDLVARRAGADLDLRIVPFRGEYYRVREDRRHLVRGLVYPVPDPAFPFLGVHLTRTVEGEVEAGPNAVLAFSREGYRWCDVRLGELAATLAYRGTWSLLRRYGGTGLGEMFRSLSKSAFVRSVQRLVPALKADDLVRHSSGVRAQAVTRDGRLVDDFRIVTTPRAIHVLNAPSPAATASLAIGERIASLAGDVFSLS